MTTYETQIRSELYELYDHIGGLDALGMQFPVTDSEAREDVTMPMCLIYITDELSDWATGFDIGDVLIAPGNGDTGDVPERDIDHVLDYLNDAFYDEHNELVTIPEDDTRWPTQTDPVTVLAEAQLKFVRHDRWCLTAYSFDTSDDRIDYWTNRVDLKA